MILLIFESLGGQRSTLHSLAHIVSFAVQQLVAGDGIINSQQSTNDHNDTDVTVSAPCLLTSLRGVARHLVFARRLSAGLSLFFFSLRVLDTVKQEMCKQESRPVATHLSVVVAFSQHEPVARGVEGGAVLRVLAAVGLVLVGAAAAAWVSVSRARTSSPALCGRARSHSW